MIPLGLLAACVLADASPEALPPVGPSISTEERTFKIAMIFIVGNEDATSSIILDNLNLHPGETVPAHELHLAEKRLAQLGLFVVDPATGIRPRIRVTASGGGDGYTNLWVEVVEKAKVARGP